MKLACMFLAGTLLVGAQQSSTGSEYFGSGGVGIADGNREIQRANTPNSGTQPLRAPTHFAASAQSQPGIIYTCAPGIASITGVCDTLNTTIAGLYGGIFANANANANIYVTLGSTSLGQSGFIINSLSYSSFRNALHSSLADANDITAFTANVPADNPLGSNRQLRLTNANFRALGFTPALGVQANGTTCPLGADGCYDGMITISSTLAAAGKLYFRSGAISPTQYDFYSVIEHETDEILGTASCAFGCSESRFYPADLFRYQSNGARSTAAGNNLPCTTSNAGNACFSLDGVTMLQPYNNVPNGLDAGDWVGNCDHPLVQNAVGCPGVANLDISPAAEIAVLDAIGYTLAGSSFTVVDKLTSNVSGLVNGTCSTPPQIGSFTVDTPQLWGYFFVTGANMGDSPQIKIIRPDGVVDPSPLTISTSPVGQNGSECISFAMPINGSEAASLPGIWAVRAFWNQSTTPLFTLNFTISPAGCIYSLSPGGEAFPAVGGTATVSVTAPSGCFWIASGSPSWALFTGSTAGAGPGAVNYQVVANAGAARSATLTVAGNSFSVEQVAGSISGLAIVGSLGQVTSEGTWKFTLDAINLGISPAQARFTFTDDTGAPLLMPLMFPQLSPGTDTLLASTLDRAVDPNAQVVIESTGPDGVAPLVGSGQLSATGNVAGFGIFSDPTFGWNAVVPLETRNASAYFLAFDNTGLLATGVAVANLTAQAATVQVIIRDDTGAQIGTATIMLPAQGHTSFLLNQQYTVTAGKRGTIEFDTPSGGRISVLGLRANGPALTTLPALTNGGAAGGSITHATYNGGFTSVFFLDNTSSASAQFTLKFLDEAGNPLQVPLSLPQSGTSTTTSALKRTLAAGAMLVVETVAQDSLPPVVGSAFLTTTGPIGAFEIFRWTTFGQEASVPLETRHPASFVLVFDDTSGLSTGVAVANLASSAANIAVNMRDDKGILIQTDSINLVAGGHASFLLPDKYPATAGKRGMVEFTVPEVGAISVVGLRAKGDGTLTTIPILTK